MRKISAFLVTMISLLSFSCSGKAPEGEMTYYKYGESNGYAISGSTYTAEVKPDGTCLLTKKVISGDFDNPTIVSVTVDKSVMEHILELFLSNKMYDYKEQYQPKSEITDGTDWSFSAKVGNKSYRSSGYQAWPDRKAFNAINSYICSFFPAKEE